jgi:hypothetical protein
MLTRAHLERARLDRLTSAQKVFFVARETSRRDEKRKTEKRDDASPTKNAKNVNLLSRSAPFASHTTMFLSSEQVAILRSPVAWFPRARVSNAALQTVLPCPPSFSETTRAQLQSSPSGSSSQTRTSLS